MQYRSFGDGVKLSVLGMGCGRVGSISNPVPMREIEATLEAAVEAGVTLFDTADIYGQGDSERTIRRVARRYPGRMFVVTKVGYVHGRLAAPLRFAKPVLRMLLRPRPETRATALQVRAQMMGQNFTEDYLRRAADNSRRRLGVDCIDGLLLHDPPTEVISSRQMHDLLQEFIRRGVASHIGVSAGSVEQAEIAMDIPAITMLQLPMKVVISLSKTQSFDRLRQRGTALLVRQILTRPGDPAVNAPPVDALTSALAAQSVTAAVVGISTRPHLQDLLKAAA
jgi:aryl-alcohol dehydrogenase-like predicted oxidoreductase